MQRTLFFKLAITLLLLVFTTNGQSCPCSTIADILQCTVTGSSCTSVNADSYNSYNMINIIYSGTAAFGLISSSKYRIVIRPVDDSDSNTIQITTMSTNAVRINLQVHLSTAQLLLPLFTGPSNILASTSTLSIYVRQNIPDASSFQILKNPSLSTMNVLNYELVFDNNSSYSGILNFPNLIYGFYNASSITISGNNHSLKVDQSKMPVSISIIQLSLKKLSLYDQILYNVYNLAQYSIEECQYNSTALFLNSNQNYDLSIIMKNNNPSNLGLPNGASAFQNLGTVASITLIEPKLDSSCLRAIVKPTRPTELYLTLGSYSISDFNYWKGDRPIVRELTINSISTLDIFPSLFFHNLDAIQEITLQGTFELDNTDICTFAGININEQIPPLPQIVVLDSSINHDPNDWNTCADTYIKAINMRTLASIKCPPNNTNDDCDRWAKATAQCQLSLAESSCPFTPGPHMNYFSYNNSYLYAYFQSQLWLTSTSTSTKPSTAKPDILNIGAIIGAICGLLLAIIVLGITIFCIRRHRQKAAPKHLSSAPGAKYAPSSHDLSHVSIATSKTSQSSRYALEKSFFPPMQPNDEIAPPLYTAPSESATSRSPYNLPSAPPAPRDSVSTHATHVYETLDS